MKLLRYGPKNQELPGVLDAAGRIRSLAEIPGLSNRSLEELIKTVQAMPADSLPIVDGTPRLGVPIAGIGKFIAVGLNYRDHAVEAGLPIPTEPVLFTKAISCLAGPNDEVMLPKGSKKTDWEVELGVVIGRTARYVAEDDALKHVAGYCVVNDVSERAFQIERGGTWDKGKGCDTFGPVGPYLVTADEVADPQDLELWLDVNGKRQQTGNTRNMIFPVSKLVSYISEFMTLYPGDLITTGTPPGVGMGHKPAPIFLNAGDVMTLGVSRLGDQRQHVVPWSSHV